MDDKDLEAMDAAGAQQGEAAPAKTQQGIGALIPPDVFKGVIAGEKEKAQGASPGKQIVEDMHKAAIVSVAKNDEGVQQKIVDQAHKTIDQQLGAIDQDNTANLQRATYDANAEACKSYGIESDVPIWQIKLMKAGHAFWFVIYWVFATIVICPINVFFKGIKAFIKSTWLAMVVAVLIYLLIAVAVPVITAWMARNGIAA